MAKPIRCAVYTRKSSDEGLEQSFNSLHAQREACEAYIASQKHEGWELIPAAFDDGGFSGGSMERPGLKALLADVEAGLIDTIVVYKVDRLSRSLSDFAKMVDRFEAKGVSFVSVTQAFNTTSSMGRLTLNMLLSFAQFEREVTGERIRDKIAASKAKGMWMGGLVPLGYDAQDRTLKINEAEAEQVRTLFDLYCEIKAVDAVVEKAFALGIRSKVRRGVDGKIHKEPGKLSRSSLYRIFSNRTYLGEIEHKGVSHPGLHEAIVPAELFQAVQDILAAQRRKAGQFKGVKTSLLAGLVTDADGIPLRATHTKKANHRYRYYAGGNLRIAAEELETLVTSKLIEHLGDPASLGLLWGDLSLLNPEVIKAAGLVKARLSSVDGPARRKALLELLDRVVISPTQIAVRIKLEALGLHGIGTLTVPTSIGRTRAKLTLVVPGAAVAKPDPALIATVAQARCWFERLASGEARTIARIAQAEQVSEGYVRHLLPAAFLAPDIVARIVEGRQPPALTASKLTKLLPLPSCWIEQRKIIADLA